MTFSLRKYLTRRAASKLAKHGAEVRRKAWVVKRDAMTARLRAGL